MASKSLIGALVAGLSPSPKMLNSTPSGIDGGSGGWFSLIREPFGGAWQSNIAVDAPRNILAFSAVFACVTLIAADIAKLGVDLLVEGRAGIRSKVDWASPFYPVLDKPNHFQTWFKFIEQWIVSKLLYGNAYVLKERDRRGIVVALYVLDGQRVTPLVADDGGVYYKLSTDHLSGIDAAVTAVTVPADEIIHDMMVSLWHPLVGVSPIFACGMSATMGNRIQANSTRFFQNLSRPSGILTTPGRVAPEAAEEYKKQWEENYGGNNVGRVAVLGNGLTYAGIGTIPAEQAQLIEQLKWTVDDVARCFHVPLWKLGDKEPLRTSVESLNQTYYADCLQAHIESIESLMDHGLELPTQMHVEFCLDGLMRMDTAARYAAKGTAVKDGWMAPNEARASEGLLPVAGGDSPMMQQQNWSLEQLSERSAPSDAAASDVPAAPPGVPTETDPAASDVNPAIRLLAEPALDLGEFAAALEDDEEEVAHV